MISINNPKYKKLEDSTVKIPRDVIKKLFHPQMHNTYYIYIYFIITKCSNLLKKKKKKKKKATEKYVIITEY